MTTMESSKSASITSYTAWRFQDGGDSTRMDRLKTVCCLVIPGWSFLTYGKIPWWAKVREIAIAPWRVFEYVVLGKPVSILSYRWKP